MSAQHTVLTIMVALNCEAKPWIDFYQLKKVISKPFSVYQSPEIEIVITGIGALSMATAVGWAAARGEHNRVWLNIGTAGHAERPLGDIFRVHGSARAADDRAHYPPMTARWRGATDALLSLDAPSGDYPGGAAVDMEANAFFNSATRFSSSELVQSVKVISDNTENSFELLDARKISALMQPHVAVVDAFAKALCALVEPPMLSGSSSELFDQLRAFKASYSQRQQLDSLLHKVDVLGLNDELASCGLSDERSIKAVLETVRALVDKAVPIIDAVETAGS